MSMLWAVRLFIVAGVKDVPRLVSVYLLRDYAFDERRLL